MPAKKLKVLSACLLLLLSLKLEAAEGPSFQSINDELGAKLGTSNVTNIQLLREVFPDLTLDGKYFRMKARRQEVQTMDVSGDGGGASEGEGSLQTIEGGTFFIQGRTYAVILAIPNAVLLLAQILPEYRFLDAIDVGQDIHANLSNEVGFLRLGSNLFAIGVVSWHVNAGEEYQNYLLVGILGEKLRVLYDGPFLYNFVEPSKTDGECRIVQRLDRPVPICGKKEEYCEVKINVVEQHLCGPNFDREKVVSSRKFSATLHWDRAKQKYQGGTKELLHLNKKRIGMQ